MTTGVRARIDGRTVALAGILLTAAALWCWGLGDRVVQPYYAAAMRSMSHSWTAFVFSGYDPAGVVTIDKPPLAFWVQAAGVWVFGFHWWAIALVQAAEGVAAVFVLHRVVRRWAGETTALVAAGLFALTPITAAINRDDLPDTLLILLLLLAAYCVTRAVEDGRTGWLVAAGAFVGLGFLTKMLMAWAVLPALLLAYLPAPVGRLRKTGQLALAGLVTLVTSLWWPLLISLWPGPKPYVGSTSDGSIWQLILGYNGFGRLLGDSSSPLNAVGTQFGGAPGPLRLADSALGGQIAWFLPLALVTIVVAAFRCRRGDAKQRAGWLLWGGWFVVYVAVFSFTGGIFHAYYTATLAPAVAVLAAAGLVHCLRHNRFAFAAAIAGTSLTAFGLLSRTPDWLPWLGFVVLGLTVVAMGVLAPNGRRFAGVGLVAILLGPLAYCVTTAGNRQDVQAASDPLAGPSTMDINAAARAVLGNSGAAVTYGRFMDSATELTAGQRETLDYTVAQAGPAPIQLAIEGGSYGADPYLVNTDARVVTLGGYLGFDPAPTASQLADWVRAGRVRFVLLPAVFRQLSQNNRAPSSASSPEAQLSARVGWLARHCAAVPPSVVGPDAATSGVLFDCH